MASKNKWNLFIKGNGKKILSMEIRIFYEVIYVMKHAPKLTSEIYDIWPTLE